MSQKIVVINAGSSSIKFKIFEKDNYKVIASGLCERIFVDGHFSMKFDDKEVNLDAAMPNHTKAIECVLEQLKKYRIITDFNEIVGVGHRTVLAGSEITSSVETTD
jgi:acetate kinase